MAKMLNVKKGKKMDPRMRGPEGGKKRLKKGKAPGGYKKKI